MPKQVFPGLPPRAVPEPKPRQRIKRVPVPPPAHAEVRAVCDHVKGLRADENARFFAYFVGMTEIAPNVYRADPKVLDVAAVMAAAELGGLVQTVDHPEARTHLVFCFPGLPPR